MNQPILSICIPTYNRLDILRETIKSIYSDIDDINLFDFEVVISDNSKGHTTQSVVKEFSYENLHYYITECDGFENSFYALSYGKGAFLKLNNNYTMFKKKTLKCILHEIKQLMPNHTQVIYTNGHRGIGKEKLYHSFNEYMAGLSYFSSWSAGYGMWKEDFDRVKDTIVLDKMFPQTSLLLTQYYKKDFAINDTKLFQDQHVSKKGGYNIFRVFSLDYVKLIKDAYEEGHISLATFNKIKNDLLYKYLTVRYFKTVIAKLDKFEYDNIKESITTYYSISQYYKMMVLSMFTPIIVLLRKIK
jgi:glycosyltransferase involved in cell wall biosynthesis